MISCTNAEVEITPENVAAQISADTGDDNGQTPHHCTKTLMQIVNFNSTLF